MKAFCDGEWRDIVGHEGRYAVSSSGQVRGPRGILKAQPDHGGYGRVTLRTGDVYRKAAVHALVMEAFAEARPDSFDIDHIDGDKTNNDRSNLRYASRSDNERNKVRNGRGNTWERNAKAKLTPEAVKEIRSALGTPSPGLHSRLARLYGITQATIHNIATGKSWAWLEAGE